MRLLNSVVHSWLWVVGCLSKLKVLQLFFDVSYMIMKNHESQKIISNLGKKKAADKSI